MAYFVETDENGDPFEVWIVKRSYALLVPVCKLGLGAALLFLCVVDPLYFILDLWGKAVPHAWLVSCHAAMALTFAGFVRAGQQTGSHRWREQTLKLFFVSTALLFVWFGVVSWLGIGDLSMVAVAQILIAAVFCYPGNFRRWLYGFQALALGLCIGWLDSSGKFLDQIQFINLPLVAVVAFAMDGHMLKHAKALFLETCRVAAERRRADAVLYNALPVDVANELKAHQRVAARRYPSMAILFADIVGFTQYSAERAPDQVLAVLEELFSEIDALVDIHGVEKIKTIGDAYMAVSNANVSALAGLALSMQALMQNYQVSRGVPFTLRIGMHCGPTIAGVIGQKRFLYDVWGDAVNLASRMESTGKPGGIQTSDAVFRALHDSFVFEARGPVDIKGKGPMPTYMLLRARDSIQAPPTTASGYTP
jgi:class 3 adenylate cyclase